MSLELKQKYASARNKYKPSHIKALFIAEAPPCNLDRFFYFEDVRTKDSLFTELIGVLYPDLKSKYLKSKRSPEVKKTILEKFQNDGYWLMDLSELPKELMEKPVEACVPDLVKSLETFVSRTTPIILIKANVFDACYNILRTEGYNVRNFRMPFPGSGQQRNFREQFVKAINFES